MAIEFHPEVDIESLDIDGLKDYRAKILAQIAALDEKEPKSMTSPAYEEWADKHEELEDILDDIQDLLDHDKPEGDDILEKISGIIDIDSELDAVQLKKASQVRRI